MLYQLSITLSTTRYDVHQSLNSLRKAHCVTRDEWASW